MYHAQRDIVALPSFPSALNTERARVSCDENLSKMPDILNSCTLTPLDSTTQMANTGVKRVKGAPPPCIWCNGVYGGRGGGRRECNPDLDF